MLTQKNTISSIKMCLPKSKKLNNESPFLIAPTKATNGQKSTDVFNFKRLRSLAQISFLVPASWYYKLSTCKKINNFCYHVKKSRDVDKQISWGGNK